MAIAVACLVETPLATIDLWPYTMVESELVVQGCTVDLGGVVRASLLV